MPCLHLLGIAGAKARVHSFVLEDRRFAEGGSALNREGIAVPANRKVAEPLIHPLGLEAPGGPWLALHMTCAKVQVVIRAPRRLVHQIGQKKR
jgi:hypothetical protein